MSLGHYLYFQHASLVIDRPFANQTGEDVTKKFQLGIGTVCAGALHVIEEGIGLGWPADGFQHPQTATARHAPGLLVGQDITHAPQAGGEHTSMHTAITSHDNTSCSAGRPTPSRTCRPELLHTEENISAPSVKAGVFCFANGRGLQLPGKEARLRAMALLGECLSGDDGTEEPQLGPVAGMQSAGSADALDTERLSKQQPSVKHAVSWVEPVAGLPQRSAAMQDQLGVFRGCCSSLEAGSLQDYWGNTPGRAGPLASATTGLISMENGQLGTTCQTPRLRLLSPALHSSQAEDTSGQVLGIPELEQGPVLGGSPAREDVQEQLMGPSQQLWSCTEQWTPAATKRQRLLPGSIAAEDCLDMSANLGYKPSSPSGKLLQDLSKTETIQQAGPARSEGISMGQDVSQAKCCVAMDGASPGPFDIAIPGNPTGAETTLPQSLCEPPNCLPVSQTGPAFTLDNKQTTRAHQSALHVRSELIGGVLQQQHGKTDAQEATVFMLQTTSCTAAHDVQEASHATAGAQLSVAAKDTVASLHAADLPAKHGVASTVVESTVVPLQCPHGTSMEVGCRIATAFQTGSGKRVSVARSLLHGAAMLLEHVQAGTPQAKQHNSRVQEPHWANSYAKVPPNESGDVVPPQEPAHPPCSEGSLREEQQLLSGCLEATSPSAGPAPCKTAECIDWGMAPGKALQENAAENTSGAAVAQDEGLPFRSTPPSKSMRKPAASPTALGCGWETASGRAVRVDPAQMARAAAMLKGPKHFSPDEEGPRETLAPESTEETIGASGVRTEQSPNRAPLHPEHIQRECARFDGILEGLGTGSSENRDPQTPGCHPDNSTTHHTATPWSTASGRTAASTPSTGTGCASFVAQIKITWTDSA